MMLGMWWLGTGSQGVQERVRERVDQGVDQGVDQRVLSGWRAGRWPAMPAAAATRSTVMRSTQPPRGSAPITY